MKKYKIKDNYHLDHFNNGEIPKANKDYLYELGAIIQARMNQKIAGKGFI